MRRPNIVHAGIALSAGMNDARFALLATKLDSSDLIAARSVFEQILGGMGGGIPDHAAETDDGVVLPLRRPAHDGVGTEYNELTFRRMTGADLMAIEAAQHLVLPTRLSRSTGIVLKLAREIFEDMDAADAWDANEVGRFLARNGRRTGP